MSEIRQGLILNIRSRVKLRIMMLYYIIHKNPSLQLTWYLESTLVLVKKISGFQFLMFADD